MASRRRQEPGRGIKLDIAPNRRKAFPMGREIKLDGGEISILKKIGLSGSPLFGKLLIDRIEEMETGEFLDTLSGLIDLGYVLSNKVNVRLMSDVEKAFFRVNPAFSKDLQDAVNPSRKRERERAERMRRR
jgi:hypothetical protein